MDIRIVAQESHSIKVIARHTGRSRNAVPRVLCEIGCGRFRKPERHSRAEAEQLVAEFEASGCGALSLLGVRGSPTMWR
jgi:hypothetical protein